MHTGARVATRRRRDSEKEPIDVTSLTAAWEKRSSAHQPRLERHDFPFWKLTLAIATAIVLAAALIWTAMEIRARYELAELNRQIEADIRRLEADLGKQEVAQKKRMFPQTQTRRTDVPRAANRPSQSLSSRVPLMTQGTSAMPPGTVACMFGYQSQRQHNGGWKQLSIDGRALPCRTG